MEVKAKTVNLGTSLFWEHRGSDAPSFFGSPQSDLFTGKPGTAWECKSLPQIGTAILHLVISLHIIFP